LLGAPFLSPRTRERLRAVEFAYADLTGHVRLSLSEPGLSSTRRYAVTGSWAAAQVAPVAPPRLLMAYVDRPAVVEQELDLRPTEAGANVALLTPQAAGEAAWISGVVTAAGLRVASAR
jgi:hypothetical protein